MIRRLQTQLILLFIAFALPVMISVGVTYWGLQTQQQDALVINLAGRQRMLIRQMTRLAFQWQSGDESTFTALQVSEQIFEQTLSALQNGGTAPCLVNSMANLHPTRDPQTLSALNDVKFAWDGYRSTLEAITLSPDVAPLQTTLEIQSDDLVQKADAVVRLYETTRTVQKPHPK